MNAHHDLTFNAKSECNMQSNTVNTNFFQQRYSVLSSIAALVPHKGKKEEAENIDAHHGLTLYEQLPA